MQKVGIVKSIWRYPIKGMAGETLDTASVNAMGVIGDRTLAVQDINRQEIQSCKFRPALLQCCAKYLAPDDLSKPIEIQFPDGERLLSNDLRINARISALLGHDSSLKALRPPTDQAFYRRYKSDDHTWLQELKATFERLPGEPLPDLDNLPEEMQKYVSILGSFFLVSPFHILTTASLTHLKALNPQADWALTRFRPNLVIEPLENLSGLVEQSWLNHTITIGNVRISCNDATPRCGAVIRKQQGLVQDASMLRTIVKEADQNLGIYGDITTAGDIHVGDFVYLCEG